MHDRSQVACWKKLVLAASFTGAPWAIPSVEAVLIQTVTGTDNTNPPLDDPGWANVGVRGICNGVYLGDRWVLTVAHVGAGSVVLDGTTYSAAAGGPSPNGA